MLDTLTQRTDKFAPPPGSSASAEDMGMPGILGTNQPVCVWCGVVCM